MKRVIFVIDKILYNKYITCIFANFVIEYILYSLKGMIINGKKICMGQNKQ